MKRSSLFTRLTLLIFISTVIGVFITHAALFINFFSLREKLPIGESVYQMSKMLASQIDIHNEKETKELLKQCNLELRYVKGDYEWHSRDDVPAQKIIEQKSNGNHAFWYHGDLIVFVNYANALYIFQGTDPLKKMGFPWFAAIIWSVFLVAIFAVVYYEISKLLKPIRTLHAGVLQADKGDFEIELSQITNDELGELIRSFNSMALKVRNDIKSRDQLLRDISHEFRSPLSRMTMALEFIPEGNIRQILKNNINILEKMTTSILEEERIDSPYGTIKREAVDIRNLLLDIADHRKQSGSEIIIKNTELCNLQADKERIRMAIANVIDNAIKYSSSNCKPVEVSYHIEDSDVIVNVTDHGIGIPESEIPFIFEPFYRVDKARKHTGGYGLGMSLTKKIINAHGGTITITSTPGVGTTITITLPIS